MLSMSDTRIEDVLPFFSNKGVDVTLLVPTDTGMDKSIMDATTPVRQFLLRNKIHDYDNQEQGPNNKVLYPAFFVSAHGSIKTTASMYRPLTKKGDPRIWFKGLRQYCNAKNLLGIVSNGTALFVYNLSNPYIVRALQEKGYAARVLDDIAYSANTIARELLWKLNAIHDMGFVDTVTRGDTGIGMTLEHLLGIPPNANKTPDYKGIELKASRQKISRQNRFSLFSQIPNWRMSKMSAMEILKTFGYMENGRLQLYCTVAASKPNSQGLFFEVDMNADTLLNKSNQSVRMPSSDVALWELETLRDRLNDKHKETFWVKAVSRIENGVEQFRFDSVVHTRKPNAHLLGTLLEESIITMDYTLSLKQSHVRDHGYLFKIKPKNVELLFPDPLYYELNGLVSGCFITI